MKNKILTIGILMMSLTFISNAQAMGQSDNSALTGSQVKLQTQTTNQGEATQIQAQNNVQVQTQNGSTTSADVGVQVQQQTRTQSGSSTGTQVQAQNGGQEKNQNGASSTVAVQVRSQVANAVQEMLQVADRNGGIGQQIRTIAQAQTQNQERIEASLERAQDRSGFTKFLIGPNYSEINTAQKFLEQNREQVKELNEVKNQLVSQADEQTLTEQIEILEQTNLQIENSLGTARKGLSLLGWVFKVFSK